MGASRRAGWGGLVVLCFVTVNVDDMKVTYLFLQQVKHI
jgi:hypothetical protein